MPGWMPGPRSAGEGWDSTRPHPRIFGNYPLDANMTRQETLRKNLEELFNAEGARPACFAHLDKIIEIAMAAGAENNFGSYLSEMMSRGWAITFPEFKDTRAFGISATKGEITHGAAWTSNSDIFHAIETLTGLTCESDR